ncbi:MAG: hypothetical protein CL609_24155 [Anaerolineaceae bacterium]|nr:hypothetical protein [Anaerolineaceae bacterium]
MTYFLAMKRSFLNDFSRLDKNLQKRIITSISELEKNPGEQRGDTIKKLIHHDKLWRYRIGDYRMIYAFYPRREVIQLLGIAPRGEVYERFNYHPDSPAYENYSALVEQALDPDEETPLEWVDYLQKLEKAEQTDQSQTLPYRLSKKQLLEWYIPEEFHILLGQCETEDQLMNCEIPQSVIFKIMGHIYPSSIETVSQEPNYVLKKPEDLEKYAKGDLKEFLLLLDADQERFVDFSLSGPTLVKGGPGSGKSTVALYRVRKLAEKKLINGDMPRILFTTYTNTLVEFSRQLLDRLMEDLPVELNISTVDRLAMEIVTQLEGNPIIVEKLDLRYALIGAKTFYQNISAQDLDKKFIQTVLNDIPEDYLWDEFNWVLDGMMVPNLAAYLRVDRSGRGIKFDQKTRMAIWRIYEYINKYLSELGKITWGGLRKKALRYVHNGQWENKGNQKYDYVLIDEAQDLTPAALSLCVELCKSPTGLFLTADASQSLYNRGFVWKNVHQSLRVTGRTRILKRNYRTTRQITVAASDIIKNFGAGDEEVLAQTYVHVGQKPTYYSAKNEQDMYIWLAEAISKAAQELHLPLGSAAILTTTNELAKEIALQLTTLGLDTKYMTGKDLDLESPKVKSLTIHSCKGLEFPIVGIPFLEEGILPRKLNDSNDDLLKHLQHERRKLYVACTRAMRRLVITGREEYKSQFLKDLSFDRWKIE